MIEYDKANVTSSYPSLTKYEVATILDKAYLALIARKLTGNNTRRVPFEYDVKAIEDLRPLITSKIVNTSTATTTASNELAFKLPDDLLYYLEGQASYTNDNSEPADNKDHFNEIVNLVDHRTAQRFRATNTNMPWIKQPVSFLQGDDVYVLYDTYKHHDPLSLLVTYLEKPASFVASLVGTEDEPGGNDNPPVVVAPPVILPNSQTFTDSLQITIIADQADHIIYRINSSVWHEYTQSIIITETSTIEAYIVLNNVASNIVQEIYTKQQSQEPSQEDPVSVTIQNCSYNNGAVHTSHIVHKGNYDGALYQKLFAFNSETSTWRQVGYEMQCSTFDTSINKVWPLGQTNGFISTDTTLKVCIYGDNLYQNIITSAQALILNMPNNSPEVPDPNTQYSTLGLFRLGESRIK